MHLDGVELGPEARLGPAGAGMRQALAALDGGRIAIAAMGVGLAQGAFELALAYARERRQFGRPIVAFQAVSFALAEMAAEIAAARALLYAAARVKDSGAPVTKQAAMAKLTAGRLAQTVAERSPAHPRRLRLDGGEPDRAPLPRRQDPRDRRGHLGGPEDGDRARDRRP